MITNIVATILISITTNVYAPKQYKVTTYYPTYPATVVDDWVDTPLGGYFGLSQEPTTRDNPNVRITEVRKIKTLSFKFEGKTWTAQVSNDIISSEKETRVVEIEERWEKEQRKDISNEVNINK